ncbi:hypothetical protein FB107DRAFT_204193 [Schizophyllum commune]
MDYRLSFDNLAFIDVRHCFDSPQEPRSPYSSSDSSSPTGSAAWSIASSRVERAIARVPLTRPANDGWLLVFSGASTTSFDPAGASAVSDEDLLDEDSQLSTSNFLRRLRAFYASCPDLSAIATALRRLNCFEVGRSITLDDDDEVPVPPIELAAAETKTRPLTIQVIYSYPRAKNFADS